MAVHKRKYRSGKTSWYYVFEAPGSTHERRIQITGSGFPTKGAATDAEAKRRVSVKKGYEPGSTVLPTTVGDMLVEFFREHGSNLGRKTLERYREQAAYVSSDLLAMPVVEASENPLYWSREWNRLLKSGGRGRKLGRPLSAKMVRHIAGVVSSAFTRAIKWKLVRSNPISDSEPPIVRRKERVVFTPAQQELMIGAAISTWGLDVYLLLDAGSGARRGELLALRWQDLIDGVAFIARSLSQTRAGLEFKGTKEEEPKKITLPASVICALAAHRKRQEEFRQQFGPDYRYDLDLIFANPDGTPLKPDSVSAAVSALCRRLKLPKGGSLHTLRHSHGSHLLANGVSLAVVSKRLGHSNVHTTATIYAHAMPGGDEEAARKWDEYQKPRGEGKASGEKLV